MALEAGKVDSMASRRILECVIWGVNAVTWAILDGWSPDAGGLRVQEHLASGLPSRGVKKVVHDSVTSSEPTTIVNMAAIL